MGVNLVLDRSVGLENAGVDLTVSACSGFGGVLCKFVLKVNFPILHIDSSSPTENNLVVSLTVANIPRYVIGCVLY